jgi:uncharacterized protein YndB with AHSA1/START domain
MAEYYEFVTVWRLEAPLEKVWERIKDSEHWHEWWQGVIRVAELKPGDADGLGSIRRSTWKSALPYKLEFDLEVTRIEAPNILEARAFGELEGTGLWTLSAENVGENKNITRVRYDWKVKTTKAWMNYLAPVAKPFFRWNHNIIMGWGGEGLAKNLNCNLLETEEG